MRTYIGTYIHIYMNTHIHTKQNKTRRSKARQNNAVKMIKSLFKHCRNVFINNRLKLLNISVTNVSTISAGGSRITQDSSFHTSFKILRFPVSRYWFFSLHYPRTNSVM